MIDARSPDYTFSPAHPQRPLYAYTPQSINAPFVSIVTAYYNSGPVFQETVTSIRRMSFANWEWVIVDDGSTDPDSIAQLDALAASEPRVRIVRQQNSGPAVARNRAASEARGSYLFQIDADDLVEPTFVEKALWFLETQPQFAFCNSWNVSFGDDNYLWKHGFEQGAEFLNTNRAHMSAVIRKDAHDAAGGYDPHVKRHEDWDYWLNLAEAGYWGYTISEYLRWYRRRQGSRTAEHQKRPEGTQEVGDFLRAKHRVLYDHFPNPVRPRSTDTPHANVPDMIPVPNLFHKPDGAKRILHMIPWLRMGGADKFSLDMARMLTARGYDVTIATTIPSRNEWLHAFTRITPDVFCLERFLNFADYPRFLSYLIASRGIDTILISNSQVGYELTPYLRARHPHVVFADYNHMEQPKWNNGGYPGMAVRAQAQFDLNITATLHLKNWMVAQGADESRIEVVHCNVDVDTWNPARYNRAAARARFGIEDDTPVLLFIGRITAQKRPLVFAQILQRLAERGERFVALVVGDGDEQGKLESVVAQSGLSDQVRFLGSQPLDDMPRIMRAGDILLLPSDYEGLALVLYEATAMEVVPVAADVGGHRELVSSDSGYLVPHGKHEVEEYVRYVQALIANPAQRQAMGRCGRERVVQQFSLDVMADGIESALQKAADLSRTSPRHTLDSGTARYVAHSAIEALRQRTVSEQLWQSREKHKSARQGDVSDAEAQLNAIMNTRAWRLMSAWWRFRRNLLAESTPQGKAYVRLRRVVWRDNAAG